MAKTRGEGLDETRRLAYMDLFRKRTEKYELAGTLVNALAHHHGFGDPDEVSGHVLAVLEGGEGEEEGRAFLKDVIAKISQELDGRDPAP